MIKQSLKVHKPGNIVLCLKSSKYILDKLFTLGGKLTLWSIHGLGSSAEKAWLLQRESNHGQVQKLAQDSKGRMVLR